MPESSEKIPTSKTLKIHSIRLLPVEDFGRKKFGPWSEEDFPFLQHPILIASPERYFLYNLHICVESEIALKNVFLEGTLEKSFPIDGMLRKIPFDKKILDSMRHVQDRNYYYTFWEWPGKEKGDSYTFWRAPDRYTLTGCVFKKYYTPTSPYPDWIVKNERSFVIDLL